MSLLAVRQRLVEEYTGRYDLVDPSDFSDAGADAYINAGQRWLDHTFEVAHVMSRYFELLSNGRWYATVPNCRAIHNVWMSKDDGGRWELCKRDGVQFRREVPGDLSLVDVGAPTIYMVGSLRKNVDTAGSTTIDRFGTASYTAAVDHFAYSGLLWSAPCEGTHQLEVWGSFYQPALSTDTDENYWTSQWPHVLAMAAARAIEQSYRNFQGVNDWEGSIRSELFGLELDLADELSTGITQLEG